MTAQAILAVAFALAGAMSATTAVVHERRMQRHRQPGVSYAAATLRRDGGWRRADLFTPEGLRHQARAARFGMLAVVLWILAFAALLVLSGT